MVSVAIWAVVPAAGVGRRMAADLPKQYLQLAGRMVIEHTLEKFLGHPNIAGVMVVLAADDQFWGQVKLSEPNK
ncbi:MAG: NTP transferase domain-containing protein, partial [Gammaproteobacteria bacterium]|nr:NTP transferase domain-containing protein [Gammaproteobacteria bacterium]